MHYIVRSFLVLGLFIGVILGYTLEIDYFSNTFDVRYLFFRAMGFGLVVAILAARHFVKTKTDELERMRFWASCILAGLAITPLLAVAINHRLASSKKKETITVQYQGEKTIRLNRFGISKGSKLSADGFYTYFMKNGEQERVRSSEPLFRNIEEGTSVELTLQKGFLGFDFVDFQ